MKRDVSELSAGECISIIDDKTLHVYDSPTLHTYKLVSDKYYETTTETSAPADSSVTCYSIQQIQDLPSQYDFITPIYHLMAIISALAIIWFAYRLIIYPFYRKTL